MSQFGEFSAIFDSFGKQLDVLMIWLFAAGLALGGGWYALPGFFPERKLPLMERVYIASIVLVMMLMAWLARGGK